MLDASWVQPIFQGFAITSLIALLSMAFLAILAVIGERGRNALIIVLVYVFIALLVAKLIHG